MGFLLLDLFFVSTLDGRVLKATLLIYAISFLLSRVMRKNYMKSRAFSYIWQEARDRKSKMWYNACIEMKRRLPVTKRITDALLDWYDAHKRTLPWRGIHDPYRTWVSETMLQQTRVETVLSYYDRFLEAFPTVEALAAADIDDVLKMWEGLGYYRRARNLHKGAQQVVAQFGGAIPSDPAELLSISGIGEYTTGAIASIAFDVPVPAVDGNVIRVVSRLFGVRENAGIPSVKRQITALASSLVDAQRPGDHNQAMMDLGATICVPGTPDCAACPLQAFCAAYAEGDPEELPVLPRKNPPKIIDYDVLLIVSQGRVLMRRRTEALLEGMWVFPMLEGHEKAASIAAAAKRRIGVKTVYEAPAGEAKHVFTHQVWQMKLHILRAESAQAPQGWQFVSPEEMEELAIPTAVAKARKAAEEVLQR